MRDILSDIVEEDKRAGEVIRRLRELLRKGAPEYAPLDLNALVTEVVGLVASDATIRNVAIRLDLASEPPRVRGDRVQIQQVLINLIRNACEAMEAAPVRRLLVSSRADGDRFARVTIADTGPGVAPDIEAQLFTAFVSTKQSGMGLGLSICRTIVEANGGRIWMERREGGGTCFHFTLPLARTEDGHGEH